jgi:hypothetical protein
MKTSHVTAITGLLLAGVAVGVAISWSSRTPAIEREHGLVGKTPVDNRAADAPKAGLVRILAKQQGGTEDSEGAVLAEVQHLGPLAPTERDQLVQNLQMSKRRREEKLAGSQVSATDSAALLAEALQLLEASRDGAAIEAINNGSYVVTQAGQAAPSLVMPECEVMCMGTNAQGQSAAITVLMPWSEHTDLARAREYYNGIRAFDDSERARRFNALPDSERFRLASEVTRICRSANSTDEERSFVRETIGFSTHLHEQSAIVIVPKGN